MTNEEFIDFSYEVGEALKLAMETIEHEGAKALAVKESKIDYNKKCTVNLLKTALDAISHVVCTDHQSREEQARNAIYKSYRTGEYIPAEDMRIKEGEGSDMDIEKIRNCGLIRLLGASECNNCPNHDRCWIFPL